MNFSGPMTSLLTTETF